MNNTKEFNKLYKMIHTLKEDVKDVLDGIEEIQSWDSAYLKFL